MDCKKVVDSKMEVSTNSSSNLATKDSCGIILSWNFLEPVFQSSQIIKFKEQVTPNAVHGDTIADKNMYNFTVILL